MTLTIRPAILADAPAMAAVHVDSWRWAYADLLPPSYLHALSLQQRSRHWATIIAAERTAAMAWVAHDEHGCCGLSSAGPTRTAPSVRTGGRPALATDIGEVYTLYVSERAAGRGVGYALFAYAVAQLKATMHTSAIVWVLEDNARARRFYERAGLRLDGERRREDVADTSFDAVRYQRGL